MGREDDRWDPGRPPAAAEVKEIPGERRAPGRYRASLFCNANFRRA